MQRQTYLLILSGALTMLAYTGLRESWALLNNPLAGTAFGLLGTAGLFFLFSRVKRD